MRVVHCVTYTGGAAATCSVVHCVVVVSAGAVTARSMLVVIVVHWVVVASADTACTMVVRTVVSAYDGAVGVVSTFAAGVVSLFCVADGCSVGFEFTNGLTDTT